MHISVVIAECLNQMETSHSLYQAVPN